MYSYDFLAHYGVIGMKWGIRRYQNKDGSLTPEGRKHLGISEKSPRHKPSNAKKLAKQRAENLEKARKAKEEKKKYEEQKQNALTKGNATEVLKFKGDLTNKELQDAYNRINLEKQLSTISASETKTTWDKIDSFVERVGKVRNYTEKGIDAYNTLAKIHNSFASEDEAWTIIGQSKEKKRDSKIDKLIRTGSVESILDASKNGKLSSKELAEALARINTEKKLSEYVPVKPEKKESVSSTPKIEEKKEQVSTSTNLEKKSDLDRAVERDPGYRRATKTLDRERRDRISREVDEALEILSRSESTDSELDKKRKKR